MPYTETQAQPELPWSGRSSHAKQASYQGAVRAARTHGEKAAAMLQVLYPFRRLSDRSLLTAMRSRLMLEPSAIQSTRATLIKLKLVKDSNETEASPYSTAERPIRVVLWELTEAGRSAVEAMRRQA